MKIADQIADFLERKKIKHIFGIIGAGNAHIFDSIYKKGYTEIICVHHEQAATMAMQTYYRTSGKITVALLTTGGGSTNGITGVVSAWADSIPGLIISGNENDKYVNLHKDLRMWGVQGYDSSGMVSKVTKYSTQVLQANETIAELEKAYQIALSGRPGPCWIDISMNIQAANIEKEKMSRLQMFTSIENNILPPHKIQKYIDNLIEKIQHSKRPLFWLGNGIRLANAQHLVQPLIEKFQIPTILSWAGIDLIDSNHPLVFGRAGTYGQRCANFILQNCDLLICIGTRLAISQIGYDINELAREAKIWVIDIDQYELEKYQDRYETTIHENAFDFMDLFIKSNSDNTIHFNNWLSQCNAYKQQFPWVNETDHPDVDGYMNSYKFLEKLNPFFKENAHIVTDMGTALLSGHQVLKIKTNQRLMTSTGLGEMGYGLPAAIGTSFALNKQEVICLNCDGGMMMNLQELQTIAHHKLPIKIFIFNNDGYLMIKHTQNALFNSRRSGVDKNSGVSCPDFSKIANAFNIPAYKINTWQDFDSIIPIIMNQEGSFICEITMHPQQLFVPKLSLAIQRDGSLISPPLEDLSPLLSRKELQKNMLIPLHLKSTLIKN
ncbi:MAG: thiamine pyrophosphate-binding protein [Sediminibacterium sp.]|nr:thiamine pyrophosphate-binding protein [Sediminibacterium sp.]